ncbi:hypothetical protein DUNSADRAFT_10173 [Dunaliella salina]|uniref:Uncharacterized protein n=1 Tax=Dunaliella salina TaxID=3046 RepID=A0ABQ7GFY6_DUNSA|nr:hypothetical protein DUNSADRAFT_10173 [Dunaliella salina]|eukprot:KAF5833522.1 hypothetical protein DUNSADRAFT_10173 [Dunaliella salina]
MSTVKASWSQLSVDGAVLTHARNLTGTLLATSSSVQEGGSFVQVWVPDVAAADWMVKSVLQVPHPITKLAWAHPESGPLLAGASEQGAVYVWEPPRPWQAIKPGQGQSAMEFQEEDVGDEEREWQCNATLPCGIAPVRHICFAPRQHGLLLSAASEDGCVRIWEAGGPLAPNSWTLLSQLQVATPRAKGGPGCTSMSWRCFSPGVPPSLVVGTADEAVVMQYVHAHMAWKVGLWNNVGTANEADHAVCECTPDMDGFGSNVGTANEAVVMQFVSAHLTWMVSFGSNVGTANEAVVMQFVSAHLTWMVSFGSNVGTANEAVVMQFVSAHLT